MHGATWSHRHRTAGSLRRWLLAGPLTIGILLIWAGTASAHAAAVSSFPAAGAHLAHAPAAVSVVFDQPVNPDSGGLVVLDSNGDHVNAGASAHPSPDTLQVRLSGSLGDGAYVANYTVTSVDGHVVSGGIVFLVGHATPGQIGQLTRRTSPQVGAVDKFGQFLTYVGVLAAGGLAFFLAFILTAGAERRRLRRWCVAASAVGVSGMIVTAGAQVALAGDGWGAVGNRVVDQQVLGGRLGAQCAVQIVGLGACLWSTRRSTATTAQFAAFYGMLISAGAFVLFGHAVVLSERWLSIPADVVHVVFAAMWIGGLIGLVAVLRTRTRAARRAGEMSSTGGADNRDSARRSSSGSGESQPTLGSGGTATAVLERLSPPTQ